MNFSGNAMFGPSKPPSGGKTAKNTSTTATPKKSFKDRFGLALAASMVFVILGALGFTSMANADTPAPTSSLSPNGTQLVSTQSYPQQTANNGSGKTVVSGSSVTTSKQTGSSYNEVKASGSVVLEYVSSTGLSKSTSQKAEKLGKCGWMTNGWNSGNGYRNGKLMTGVWKDSTRQYVCYTGKGPSGYQVKKCGNYYWPKGKTPGKTYPRYTKVVLVNKLAGRTLTGTVSATTTSKATGSSESWAETSQCKAHGYGHYDATSTATGTASFKIVITEKMNVKAKLTSAFVKFALQQQTKATASAWAKASSEAQGEARSSASCTDVTPPAVVVTPPVQVVPGPTVTVTASVPGPTVTVTAPATPGPTVTVTTPGTPGPTTTVTVPATPGPTVTVTQSVPGPEKTITVPGPTTTVTVPVPGPTVTVTVPATTPPTTAPQKPSINIERMNDQQISTSTKGIKVGYTVGQNGSKNITIHAKYGTVTDVVDNGNGQVTFTYTAPTEGTPDNTDTITAGITANGMSDSDATTFKILVPGNGGNIPAPPL